MSSTIRILCGITVIQAVAVITTGCGSSAEQQAQRQRAADVAAAQRRDAEARSSQVEANMRTILRTYIVGTTTLQQFHADREKGEWRILQVKDQLEQDRDYKVIKTTPVYTIGTAIRALCDVAFEGNATKVLLKAVNCK